MDSEAHGHLLPTPVEIIDVTGAGDALMAGLVFGLSQGEPLDTACRLGMIAARLTLQTNQTVAGLTADQLYQLLEQHQ
ncbi:fructoselysine 6-kinase [compost metagenome]